MILEVITSATGVNQLVMLTSQDSDTPSFENDYEDDLEDDPQDDLEDAPQDDLEDDSQNGSEASPDESETEASSSRSNSN